MILNVDTDRWLYDLPEAIAVYIIGGLTLILDGGMFYISMIIMSIMFFGYQVEAFRAYSFSILIAILLWFMGFPIFGNTTMLESAEVIAKFYLPSATVAIVVNWLVFRKTYRRLREEAVDIERIENNEQDNE